MRRLPIVLLLAAITVAWSAPAAAAGFAPMTTHTWEGLFTGSRLSAMGGADIAGDDGPGALMVNPAPLMRGNGIAVGHDHVDYPLAEVASSVTPDEDLDYVSTAIGIEWQGWRFSACLSDESMDNGVVRTAYLPEGTGTIDRRSRMTLVGLARQVMGTTGAESGLQWTIGGDYRSFSAKTTAVDGEPAIEPDNGTTTGTWDVGTTAAYRFTGDAHRAGIAATIAWQNVADSKWVADDRELELPHAVRVGLSTGMTFLSRQREWVRVFAAIARSEYMNTIYDKGYNQVGVEVTFMRMLAVRAGSNDRFYGGSDTWGLGLVLDHPRGRPLELAVDYGVIMPDSDLSSLADIAMWSGRVRVDF